MDEVTGPRALIQLATRQHGLVSRRQAAARGINRSAWRHATESGAWVACSDRVLCRAGAPPSAAQRALAAVLDVGPDAYVSHRSAAALWELPGFSLEPLHLIVVRDGKETATDLATIHRPRYLPDPYAATVDGVPLVRPALVLLQLAAEVHPDRLARLFDHCWSRRLLSGRSARVELDPVLGRGRPGTRVMRAILDERGDDYVPPASNLEARFLSVLGRDGDQLRRQVDVGGGEQWCGRVDFRHKRLPLVAEIDGDRFHAALTSRADDAVRQTRLERAGLTVVRFSEHEVWHRPGTVRDRFRRACDQLRNSCPAA